MLIRFLLLASLFNAVSAALEDHFKKIVGKDGPHQMRNIDFIYMINLDNRPEKFEKSSFLLSLYGVYPYRFSAVNGWELSFSAIDDVGVKLEPWMTRDKMGTYYYLDDEGNEKYAHEIPHAIGRNYFCHCMSRGSIGICLSHLSILQDAYDSGYETIWVMEDDIEVIRSPHLLSQFVEKLDALVGKRGWDILFTDRDTKNSYGQYVPNTAYAWTPNYVPYDPSRFEKREDISPEFRRLGARFGAYSMIVHRSGMKKILDFIKQHQIFVPFDIEYTLPPQIRLFTVTSDVVSTQPGAPSDNGGPNYEKGKI